MNRIIIIALLASVFALDPGVAHAEDDPNSQSGCCVHFNDSPVNIFICTVEKACAVTPPPARP